MFVFACINIENWVSLVEFCWLAPNPWLLHKLVEKKFCWVINQVILGFGNSRTWKIAVLDCTIVLLNNIIEHVSIECKSKG